jgi:hypothetical protein
MRKFVPERDLDRGISGFLANHSTEIRRAIDPTDASG